MKRTNWTKKATVLLAAICLALAVFSGVTARPGEVWLLQVEGVPVSRELYSYFLSEALQDPAYAESNADAQGRPKDEKALRADVAARCAAFIAVNSELRSRAQPLEAQYKMQVAERVSSIWRVFGPYYSAIGVSKQTITGVQEGILARAQLFRTLYDTGGPRAVPEEEIEAYFYGSHVAYNGLRVFLTKTAEDGSEVPLAKAELDALREELNKLAEAVNDGTDFFAAAQEYGEALSYASPSPVVVHKSSGEYPEEAFEKVRALSPDKATLLEYPDFFLVAMGLNMRESREEYYLAYRDSCLRDLKYAAYEQTLEELFQSYRADENVAAVDRFFRSFTRWPEIVPTGG
ncbi:MAG: hypothetical protein FWH26_02140 [Oscillospiraceae bacterium]|nr:hypothetical protein [Oscillospiraceae bacterium]